MYATLSLKSKKQKTNFGDVAHQLRPLATLTEDMSSVPNTHIANNCPLTVVQGRGDDNVPFSLQGTKHRNT